MRIFLVTAATAIIVLMGIISASALAEEHSTEIVELTDETFEGVVFPISVPYHQQKPFFIFFYAPWCGHCKKTKPIFHNASDYLATSPYAKESARFALVDATTQKQLAQRFHVKSFPTFYYTVHGRAYHYEGGRGMQEFIQIAVYLFRGHQLGSFADDVSSPERFEAVDKEAPGRAAFVVFVPKSAPRQHDRRDTPQVGPYAYNDMSEDERHDKERVELEAATPFLWHIAVESSITLGKSRYAVIFEDRIPSTVKGDHVQFSKVMEVAHRCERVTKGPNGESLILFSDAHRKPLCYLGPWFQKKVAQGDSGKKSKRFSAAALDMPRGVASITVHEDLREWIDRNSFLAVEEISAETYTTLSRRPGLMLVLATHGPLTKDDTNYLPALRALVQERNAAEQASEESLKSRIEMIDADGEPSRPRREFIFTHLDGLLFKDWCAEHGISESDLPAVLAVSPMKEIAYHAKDLPAFVEVKDNVPWDIHGPQLEQIRVFLKRMDRGEMPTFRVSTVGKVAEKLLMIPYADVLYAALGSDDTTFLTVLFVAVFTVFVVALALRPDPRDSSLDLAAQQPQRHHQAAPGTSRVKRPAALKEE